MLKDKQKLIGDPMSNDESLSVAVEVTTRKWYLMLCIPVFHPFTAVSPEFCSLHPSSTIKRPKADKNSAIYTQWRLTHQLPVCLHLCITFQNFSASMYTNRVRSPSWLVLDVELAYPGPCRISAILDHQTKWTTLQKVGVLNMSFHRFY